MLFSGTYVANIPYVSPKDYILYATTGYIPFPIYP